MNRNNRPPAKDMYWFAHGGIESEKTAALKATEDDEGQCAHSPTIMNETKGNQDDLKVTATQYDSSGPSSLDRDGRFRTHEKRHAAEERRKQLAEAEQERNDALLRKHLEREAAIEARRNAQRSNIAFAFGSTIPKNDSSLTNDQIECDMSHSYTAEVSSPRGEDIMTRSMTAAIPSAPRGRRKNDLMPAVPYKRSTPTPRATTSSRKRSVSMTRLDQLAKPRKHYLEANKASKSPGAASNAIKDLKSPSRPLSSASEHSAGSGKAAPSSVTRRFKSSPRKPRPVSIAGTVPDAKSPSSFKPFEVKAAPPKRNITPSFAPMKSSTPKQSEKSKPATRPSTTPKTPAVKHSTPKTTTLKLSKQSENKSANKIPTKPKEKDQTFKKKKEPVVAVSQVKEKESVQLDLKSSSPAPVDSDTASESEKSTSKRIISEEEAKAALAEKRRLAREQAEKEAELERLRLEELRLAEEERLLQEEEEHKRLEEEQLRLLEEHRRQEDEKLRKAIEEREQREEEERSKRDEENRMKLELEKKAKEEAEKQKMELEEKLRKEEEERAERKKRLEKIMSRTRGGKSNGTSPSGSVSGSDQLETGDNVHEGFSSGANSLDSNETGELNSELAEIGDSHPTYDLGSENASLNSNDLMMPVSETASQDNSLLVLQENFSPMTANEDIVEKSKNTNLVHGSIYQVDTTSDNSIMIVQDDTTADNDLFVKSKEDLVHSSFYQEEVLFDDQYSLTEHPRTTIHPLNEDQMIKPEENLLSCSVNLGNDADDQRFSTVDLEFQVVHEDDCNTTEPISPNEKQLDKSSSSHPKEMFMPEGKETVTNSIVDENIDFSSAFDVAKNYQKDALEPSVHNSFSDIKLPDPIYETSDEGSVSSEKQIQEYKLAEQSVENQIPSDDVFTEHVEKSHAQSNPFELAERLNEFSSFTVEDECENSSAYRNGFNASFGNEMSNSIFMEKQLSALPDPIQESYGCLEDSLVPSNGPNSNVNVNPFSNASNSEIVDNLNYFPPNSQFDSEDLTKKEEIKLLEAAETLSGKENIIFESVTSGDAFQFNDKRLDISSGGDNPLVEADSSTVLRSGSGDHDNHLIKELSSRQKEIGDVTIIKSSESGACVGIISSLDHDQTCYNDLPPKTDFFRHNNSNFECASVTDSEDSSLDSNLSQIMTVEDVEKEECADHLPKSNVDITINSVFNNEQQHNPFGLDPINGDSISKSNGSSVTDPEIFSNGHGNAFSKHTDDFNDGTDILSVDPAKNNIFESVNAIAFGKVSPDPFLGKGSSISGNTFHLPEEQKQAFVAQDFSN